MAPSRSSSEPKAIEKNNAPIPSRNRTKNGSLTLPSPEMKGISRKLPTYTARPKRNTAKEGSVKTKPTSAPRAPRLSSEVQSSQAGMEGDSPSAVDRRIRKAYP